MRGGKIKTPNTFGYTLVEVMIFVAVSGFMFVLSAVFINGKQAAAEYRQGLNGVNTQIQGVINDVANGEYPSAGSFTCAAQSNGTYNFNSSATTQGANGGLEATGNKSGCTFMGKVIQFGVGGEPTQVNTYVIAGRQYADTDISCTPVAASDDITPTSFCQAKPVVIDFPVVSLTSSETLQHGLNLTRSMQCVAACSTPTPTMNDISAIGFFGSFASYGAAGSTDLQSGAQTVTTVALNANSPPNDDASMINNINNNLKNVASTSPQVVNNGSFVVLCFDSAGREGAVVIGGTNAQQLTTSIIYGAVGVAQSC